MRKKFFLLSIAMLLITGCSLTGRVAQINYFTLEPIKNSCISKVKVEGEDYLLSDRILIKRTPYKIGNLPSSFWITSLQNILTTVISASEGNRTLNLTITALYLEATDLTLRLKGTGEICNKSALCKLIKFDNARKIDSPEPINIIESIQMAFEEIIVQELCTLPLSMDDSIPIT